MGNVARLSLSSLIISPGYPLKVIVSGEGVGLASQVLEITQTYARAVQHWSLPEVPIEIAPFTFTEWARGAAVIALRHQLSAAVRPDA